MRWHDSPGAKHRESPNTQLELIETNSPNSADYTLKIEYSYRAEFDFQGGDDFALGI